MTSASAKFTYQHLVDLVFQRFAFVERRIRPQDASGEATKTVTLGVQQFIGQYATDWNAVLAALSMAVIPVLVLYMAFSRQLIRGLTAGAVK